MVLFIGTAARVELFAYSFASTVFYENSGISKIKGTSLWNVVPNYGLRKFGHGTSAVVERDINKRQP